MLLFEKRADRRGIGQIDGQRLFDGASDDSNGDERDSEEDEVLPRREAFASTCLPVSGGTGPCPT